MLVSELEAELLRQTATGSRRRYAFNSITLIFYIIRGLSLPGLRLGPRLGLVWFQRSDHQHIMYMSIITYFSVCKMQKCIEKYTAHLWREMVHRV